MILPDDVTSAELRALKAIRLCPNRTGDVPRILRAAGLDAYYKMSVGKTLHSMERKGMVASRATGNTRFSTKSWHLTNLGNAVHDHLELGCPITEEMEREFFAKRDGG